jgi:hypothetical protein
MSQKYEDRPASSCPLCGMAMVLVRIDPRITSFTELLTFRCSACGDVRAIEHEKTHYVRAAAWPRPGLFH